MIRFRTCSSFARRTWRRLSKASKTEFALDFLNGISLTYQFVASVTFAAARLENGAINPLYGQLFLVAFAYSAFHRVYLKDVFQKRKWKVESIRRSEAIGVALTLLANSVRKKSFTHTGLHQIEQGLLIAMKSEVESILGDSQGIYLAVNLMVEEPNSKSLLVLNRSNMDRDLYSIYPKTDLMIAWKAMKYKRLQYEADFESSDPKPYRAILAVPIVSRHAGTPQSLGAISIDSSVPYHFDGYESKLETSLLTYISIHKLVLTYRNDLNLWRPS